MKFLSARVSRLLLLVFLAIFSLFLTPSASAAKEREEREVRIASVQGDVRISRGDKHRADLNKPWEQALDGDAIEQGYALATANGRAEIEFENGSMVYLAENSLLLFPELTTDDDGIFSNITLATGTATFYLHSGNDESFVIDTPTDQFYVSPLEKFSARLDAYLDATAATPQGEKGIVYYHVGKGETLFLRHGEFIQFVHEGSGIAAKSEALSASQVSPASWESILQSLPDFQLPPLAYPRTQNRGPLPVSSSSRVQAAREWDDWVSSRLEHRNALLGALKASNLPWNVPGMTALYDHGTFFRCEPYGICWEANDTDDDKDTDPQSAPPEPQSGVSPQTQTNTPFQPQTVQWDEWSRGWCSPATLRTVTRVARTPEELQRLLRQKEAAERARYFPSFFRANCENGLWIPHRRHYARVVTPQLPPKLPHHCVGKKCKPVHAPRPILVKVGRNFGFIPAHPNDVKGKPPLNLKWGIFAPPVRPGEPVRHIDWDPSQKVKWLNKPSKELPSGLLARGPQVSAPEIRGHLAQEVTRANPLSGSAQAVPQISYDYKSRFFLMASSSVSGGKLPVVPVGGIDSHGRVGSFASGNSISSAQSFSRGEGGSSNHGSTFGSSRGYGSSYSGGGHTSGSSGSYSSGSSGSHSSGGGSSSYGGGSSHSSSGSSGGSSSSSSGGSSSSSSSSSSGGGTRGRP